VHQLYCLILPIITSVHNMEIQKYIESWLSNNWSQQVSPLPPITSELTLTEDLGFDNIAREEFFSFLDSNLKSSTKLAPPPPSFVFQYAKTMQDIYDYYSGDTESSTPKIAFLFPGQGSQVVGMVKEVISNPNARELFTIAKDVLGYDLLDLCLNGPQSKLDDTSVSQVAIFVSSLAALTALRDEQPELIQNCTAAAGLSLGEYTALVWGGAMDFRSGLLLVKCRAEAMQAAAKENSGGMVSILQSDEKTIEQMLSLIRSTNSKGSITIANYLCPGNIVVAGDSKMCGELESMVISPPYNRKAKRLAVAGAFHSDSMKSAYGALEEALLQTQFSTLQHTVMCNFTGSEYDTISDHAVIRNSLLNQLTSPVRWEHCVRHLLSKGYTQFYEIGPGTVLTGLMRHILRGNAHASDIYVEKVPC